MDLSTEDEEFQRANEAYMDKFDPPLVTAIRDSPKRPFSKTLYPG